MKIKLICVGKLKEAYLRDGIAEYQKRLSRFCQCDIIELADEKHLIRLAMLKNSRLWLRRLTGSRKSLVSVIL